LAQTKLKWRQATPNLKSRQYKNFRLKPELTARNNQIYPSLFWRANNAQLTSKLPGMDFAFFLQNACVVICLFERLVSLSCTQLAEYKPINQLRNYFKKSGNHFRHQATERTFSLQILFMLFYLTTSKFTPPSGGIINLN